MKTIFLQFANIMKINGEKFIGLGNGFSDTWDYCNKIGEFKWFLQEYSDKAEEKKTEEAIKWCLNSDPPITDGTMYASAINITNLFQLYTWANRFPSLKIIVGGPAVCTSLFTLLEKLPENLVLTDKSVEEYFGIKNFSYKWKLIPPDFNSQGIAFAYTIDTTCYWGKCIFCGPHAFCKERKREKIDFEFSSIDYNKKIFIRINSPSISPKQLQLLNNLPKKENIRYSLMMRGTENEAEEIKKLVEKNNGTLKFSIGIGLEFPSDKMYAFMNKGLLVENMKNSILSISKLPNVELILTGILGWTNLDKNDLNCLFKFFEEIKNSNVNKLILYRLKYVPIRNNYLNGEAEKELKIGPFFLGYYPKLTKEQIQLNNEALEIIKSSSIKVVNYYE